MWEIRGDGSINGVSVGSLFIWHLGDTVSFIDFHIFISPDKTRRVNAGPMRDNDDPALIRRCPAIGRSAALVTGLYYDELTRVLNVIVRLDNICVIEANRVATHPIHSVSVIDSHP